MRKITEIWLGTKRNRINWKLIFELPILTIWLLLNAMHCIMINIIGNNYDHRSDSRQWTIRLSVRWPRINHFVTTRDKVKTTSWIFQEWGQTSVSLMTVFSQQIFIIYLALIDESISIWPSDQNPVLDTLVNFLAKLNKFFMYRIRYIKNTSVATLR